MSDKKKDLFVSIFYFIAEIAGAIHLLALERLVWIPVYLILMTSFPLLSYFHYSIAKWSVRLRAERYARRGMDGFGGEIQPKKLFLFDQKFQAWAFLILGVLVLIGATDPMIIVRIKEAF